MAVSRTQPLHRRNAAGRPENHRYRKGGPPLIDKTEGRARLAGLSAMIAAKRSGKKDI
ncbi:hypothetical protein [Kingella potus]|uniref:hypothetical protein n=1 Tax=Kingella potus TaxID=265175 RepID=UPI001FD068D4|nr:hypothetical protein [Kingella potus]UOP01234.1 hypothetical protein LVJ84_02865 [Kingella potus]